MIRRFKVIGIKVSKALSKSGLPDLDYALNPYIGCSHSCMYCYARLYTGLRDVSTNWGRVVYIKENIIDILKREVVMYKPGVVGLSTITDPYQPVESIYKLTRKSIELLVKNGFKISIQTKNSLVLRDLDILAKYRNQIDIGFTITSFNKKIIDLIEPYSTPPKLRLEALKKISDRGIKTWIFYGPIIPGLNDDEETIREIVNAGVNTNSKILVDSLHIKSFMNNSNYLLYSFLKQLTREWWISFLNKLLKICNEYSVECIPGLAEPLITRNKTIDDFI